MKKVLVDNIYEFDLLIEDNEYTLYYNHSDVWCSNIKGIVAFKCVNTGNGYKVKSFKKKNFIEYDEAFYLYLILSLEKDYKLEIVEQTREL